jgi:formyl-CoA transferase
MSGVYDFKNAPGAPPAVAPVGALGDISAAMFGVIGVLAALRHRDRTGEGQHVDIAMLDSVIAMTDIVTNFWSMGVANGGTGTLIMHAFRAADGWFVMQVGREHQFAKLVSMVGHPEWVDDPRFATRAGWVEHLDDVIRPAVEGWAAARSRHEACAVLGEAGIAAGPCAHPEEVVRDRHVELRNMLVEVPRTDGVAQPVLVPGNPVKLSKVAEGPETRVPWLGEHTDAVLSTELGLSDTEMKSLREAGVIG